MCKVQIIGSSGIHSYFTKSNGFINENNETGIYCKENIKNSITIYSWNK